jgi:hypothetical protein
MFATDPLPSLTYFSDRLSARKDFNMADASSIVWTKNDLPYNWDPDRAVPFFELAGLIDKHLRSGLAIQREHLLVIFCHETAFANVRQNQGKGPAVGFGQMEIFNKDKIPFFATLRYNSAILNPKLSLYERSQYSDLNEFFPLTYESVLNDNEFAVRMHCAYFAWLNDEGIPYNAAPGQKGIKSLRGMLAAQTGGGKNQIFIDHFIQSGDDLKAVINSGDRKKIIAALNGVRHYFKTGTSVTESRPLTLERYSKYWDFILPESAVNANADDE